MFEWLHEIRKWFERPTHIVVVDGPSRGLRVPLDVPEVTIGRDTSLRVVIDDHYASMTHCSLVYTDGYWLLSDAGSTNGTYLDRGKINAPTPVPIGMPIRVGSTILMLVGA